MKKLVVGTVLALVASIVACKGDEVHRDKLGAPCVDLKCPEGEQCLDLHQVDSHLTAPMCVRDLCDAVECASDRCPGVLETIPGIVDC